MPPKRKPPVAPEVPHKGGTGVAHAPEVRPATAALPVDFDEIRAAVRDRPEDSSVLLNIPIWGWTGDGKTCALLTAVHYCDPIQHPLAFALVRNPDDLNTLEQSVEEYRGLHLAPAAAATTQRLLELSEAFIDRNEWPPGTDEPSAYVLAIRSIGSTIGYAIFPDIKGGSFRELDETAREVLKKAHAAILLVNPELYVNRSTDGKRYRDEILDRLQRFASAGVPVSVMITKADLHQGPHQATDATHKELSLIVDGISPKMPSLVTRVSVIGTDNDMVDKKLPSAADRHPDQMVAAFIWTVAEALKRPVVESRKLLLSVNIRALAEQPATIPVQQVPELRQAGEYSGSPGTVLCATTDDGQIPAFAFVSSAGELFETRIGPGSGEAPAFDSIGSMPEWHADVEVQAYYSAGEVVVGAKAKCNHIWQGGRGGALTKAPLPYEMAAWGAATARRVIGVDSSGRLHSFRFDGGKWVQADFIESFISPSAALACAFVDATGHAFAFNGASIEGVAVAADGTFGGRVAPSLVCKYDMPRVVTNRLGLCAAIMKNAQAVMSAPGKMIELGATKPDAAVAHALAPARGMVAVVGTDLRLSAAAVSETEVRRTGPHYSPVLPKNPDGLVWSSRAELLVATFGDGTWALFKPFGMG